MFRRRDRITRETARDRWQPLPPDDPFVKEFGHPGEVIYDGLVVLDWDQRMTPGSVRATCERLIVVTSQRVLILDQSRGDTMDVPYEGVRSIDHRQTGAQGFVSIQVEAPGVPTHQFEFSMHKDVAPLLAERLRSFWSAVDRSGLLDTVDDSPSSPPSGDDGAPRVYAFGATCQECGGEWRIEITPAQARGWVATAAQSEPTWEFDYRTQCPRCGAPYATSIDLEGLLMHPPREQRVD